MNWIGWDAVKARHSSLGKDSEGIKREEKCQKGSRFNFKQWGWTEEIENLGKSQVLNLFQN